MRASVTIATALCGCLVLCVPALAVAPDERPAVTTLSGTGELGSRDGRRPSYTLPVGIAFDRSGRLYVADAAAQRIRVVERNGIVRTVAGPDDATHDLATEGGYADGPARQARFSWPMGVAIGADGALYVADSMNRCIRRVAPNGSVSTFAGRPRVAGHEDGARGVATFQQPTAIASDGRDLYVADRYAIRKVSPDGSVTTIGGLGNAPWAVAVRARSQGNAIVVADRDGIVGRFYVGTAFVERRFASPQGGRAITPLMNLGDRVIGDVFGLVMLDDNTVVYTDPRTESVRLLELISGETKVLAGSDSPDGTADQAGFAVGPLRPVDADIDHGRARLDPVAAHHLGPAHRGINQVGLRT